VIEDDITSEKGRYHIEGGEKNEEIEMPVTLANTTKFATLLKILNLFETESENFVVDTISSYLFHTKGTV
jgi:hypothetical protein